MLKLEIMLELNSNVCTVVLISHLPHPSNIFSVKYAFIFHRSRTDIFSCGEFTSWCGLQVSLNAYCLLNAFWSDFGLIVSDENCTLEQQENITKSYRPLHHFPPFLSRKVDQCKLYRTNQSLRSLHC